MTNDQDFTIDAGTGNVLLQEELLHKKPLKSYVMDAAIYRGDDVSNIKNALDIKRRIVFYFMFLLYHGKSFANTTWWPPKRAKVETPPNHWTVSVSPPPPFSVVMTKAITTDNRGASNDMHEAT